MNDNPVKWRELQAGDLIAIRFVDRELEGYWGGRCNLGLVVFLRHPDKKLRRSLFMTRTDGAALDEFVEKCGLRRNELSGTYEQWD